MTHPRPAAPSRRRALAAVAGLAAGLTATKLGTAQEATPAPATDDAERIFTMFVQTAQAGGFQPKPGEVGIYQIHLQGASAQTVYFSDRPRRIVGSVSTEDFLAGLGFSSENPPNAAIVAQTEDGNDDVVIVELLDPHWDSVDGILTYDVIVLDEYTGDGFGDLAQRQDDGELPETFGHTSLFIDDCPDVTKCWSNQFNFIAPFPWGPVRMCWDPIKYGNLLCSPCDGRTRDDLGRDCYNQYPNVCVRQGGRNDPQWWECTGI